MKLTKKDIIKNAKDAIEVDGISFAIHILQSSNLLSKEQEAELSLIAKRHNTAKKDYFEKKVMNREEYEVESNKMAKSFLLFCDELEDSN